MTMEQEKPVLYLVDGSNHVYRAFHATPPLTTSKGFPTNAIYAFTNMLLKVIREKAPEYMAVVFDVKGPTFRHEAYEDYKATRKPMPDELSQQLAPIRDLVRGFSIPLLERQGMEADDVIGSLARRFEKEGVRVVILSGDKDFMQLVSDRIVLLDTMRDRLYDEKGVRERFGVGPDRVVDILGLTGDTSDNVPGVPGIGDKTARKLVEEYGGIEEILNRAESIPSRRIRENLLQYAEQARLSRELVTIRTDLDVGDDLEAFRIGPPDTPALRELFREFEFSSLLQSLKGKEEAKRTDFRVLAGKEDLSGFIREAREKGSCAVHMLLTSPDSMAADLAGVALCLEPGKAVYLPAGNDGGVPGGESLPEAVRPLLEDGHIAKWAHDAKSAEVFLARKGIALEGLEGDTMVAAYLLNPTKRAFDLPDLSMEFLNREATSLKDIAGSGARAVPLAEIPAEKLGSYACECADRVRRLSPVLLDRMREDGSDDLFHKVEMPLVSVLASMERKGVLLDAGLLKRMSAELGELMALSEQKIHILAGEPFNINSPKQLQEILFVKLKLPRGRKIKTGHSTDVDVLTWLAQSYELPAEILSYRSLMKLKSTYVDALPLMVNPETGRLHTSFNQTATATGRLSSSNPNLQNIPVRTLEGKRIRQAFVASPGHVLLSADYSQIELRILAHLSGDETLIQTFERGEDIHRRTAADVFGVFPELVNEDMRRHAKVINFGILYGMSPFGLSRELGVDQKLAKAYIDEYFRRYKGVRAYIDGILEGARKDGFVTTLLNRRRYLPELAGRNGPVRQFAERTAVNTPIQGTAADLIKAAMINIWNLLRKKSLSGSMILQVHDELVFEVPEGEREETEALVRKEMEEVIALKVPLKVEIHAGKNWDEAH